MATYQSTATFDNNAPTDTKLRDFLSKWYAAFETGPMEQTADTGQLDTATVTWAGLPTSSSSPAYQIHKLNDSLFGDAPIYVKTAWYTGSSFLRFSIGASTGTDGAGNLTGFSFPLTTAGGVTSGAVDITIDIIGSGADGYGCVFIDPGGVNTTQYSSTYLAGVFRTTDENDQPDTRGALLVYYYISTSVNGSAAGMRYVALDFQSNTYQTLGQAGFWQHGGTTTSVNPSLRKDVSRVVIPFTGFTWVCPHLVGTYREEHGYGSPFVANPSGNPHQYQQVKGARYAGVNTDGAYSTLAVIWE